MFGFGKKKKPDIYKSITTNLIASLRRELYNRASRGQPLVGEYPITFTCPAQITEEDMKDWYQNVWEQVEFVNESSINIFGIKM